MKQIYSLIHHRGPSPHNARVVFNRLRHFKLHVLFAVALILSSFAVQLINTPTANAEESGSFLVDKVSGEVLDHQLWYYAVACASTVDIDKVPEGELKSGAWFKTSGGLVDAVINIGDSIAGAWERIPKVGGFIAFSPGMFIIDNELRGKGAVRGDMYQIPVSACEDSTRLEEALSRFGLDTDYATFCALDIAYSKRSGGPGKGDSSRKCTDGEGQGDFDASGSLSDQRQAFIKLLNSTPKGPTAQGTLNPYAEYVRYYRTFMQGCDPTLVRPYDEGSGAGGDANAFKLAVVDQDGSIRYVFATTEKTNDGTELALVATSTGGYKKTTCGKAATKTRDYATAYSDWLRDPRNADAVGAVDNNDIGGDSEEETSCAIDGIGWLVCPVVNFAAGITDASYTAVAAMLTVQKLTTQADGPYKAWEAVRNIANIAFVIAFLIVIYSQMTGAGISNYGIKRMLPRLIIAAILVNISYWICAIAVDLSNILGTSIKAFLDSANSSLPVPSEGLWNGGNSWTNLAGLVLIGGIALAVGLSAFLPLLITALFAIVVTFLILTLRQGLLILLIVIAPLAFVAYLLPNTESWFKRWMSLLQVLLMMFPLISLIFGASAIAGTIIMQSAEGQDNDGLKIALQSMGAGVTIIPLFILPIVMKTAGGLLGKIGATINNPNKGPFDRMKKGAQAFRQDRQNVRNLRAIQGSKRAFGRRAITQWGARRKAQAGSREAELKHATTSYNAKALEENSGYANRAAGGTAFNKADPAALSRVLASAKAARSKELMEEIENLVSTMDKGLASDIRGLEKAFNGTDSLAEKAAYAKQMARAGSPGVKALKGVLTDYSNKVDRTNTTEIGKELDLKDVLGSDQTIRNAGRDFEVWANNEGWTDQNGNQRSGAERTFSQVANDTSVWKDISAQRFASMSPVSQEQALGLLTTQEPESANALAQRIVADSTAMGNIKGRPQEQIKTILGTQSNTPPQQTDYRGDGRGYL